MIAALSLLSLLPYLSPIVFFLLFARFPTTNYPYFLSVRVTTRRLKLVCATPNTVRVQMAAGLISQAERFFLGVFQQRHQVCATPKC